MALPCVENNAILSEGASSHRPPLFKGEFYLYWKNRMRLFLESVDLEIWDIVENSFDFPIKMVNGEKVRKSLGELTPEEKHKVQLNSRAMNILSCGLGASEYNRIMNLKTAYEIWSKLEVTYEGTSQVKETKINMLVHEYELFRMNSDETIKSMFTRFTNIVNGLSNLGKEFSTGEQVRKILRVLPQQYDPLVTALKAAKNISAMSLDELLGELLTNEIELARRKNEEHAVKKKRKKRRKRQLLL
ncbi:hypothetical protein HPP92_023440 [Vanilla planifolia]|uniref:Uncharacterized protein n=1 Tax=Vanilla planifolia TaxID=51239 RepID=A0A835UG22_VANPL|nr:hypothetical protein HPP92_023732 [Vanilla planifolia]KAG0460312.1 hypothetical protein HPP92_023440 [Vanilla planifolia]